MTSERTSVKSCGQRIRNVLGDGWGASAKSCGKASCMVAKLRGRKRERKSHSKPPQLPPVNPLRICGISHQASMPPSSEQTLYVGGGRAYPETPSSFTCKFWCQISNQTSISVPKNQPSSQTTDACRLTFLKNLCL